MYLMGGEMLCYACNQLIGGSTFVTSRKEEQDHYFHVHCYYPRLLLNYKSQTKDFVYYAIDEVSVPIVEVVFSTAENINLNDYVDEIDASLDHFDDEFDDDDDLPYAA